MRRVDEPEWMDTRVYPRPTVRETLRFLDLTNRTFGGARVVLRYFQKWSKHWPAGKTIRVLDVGTGGAVIPMALVSWARTQGFSINVTAIDLVEDIAEIAKQSTQSFPEIKAVVGDVFDLEKKNETFDYVVASLFLHHIPPSENARVLQTFDALSTRGVVVSDLQRSRAGLVSVAALSWLIGNAVVRHDGPLSVRRAFRVEELSALARESGLTYLRAQKEPWFRVSLAGEK